MNKKDIEKLLEQFKSGQIEKSDVLEKLKHFPYDDIDFAKIDNQRHLRKGFPEVIFCQGKSAEQIEKICKRIKETGGKIIATRANDEIHQKIKKIVPEIKYFKEAGIVAEKVEEKKISSKFILVVSGGTADIPVAEEAGVMAELMGNRVERLYDVGVAGIHRLLDNSKKLVSANVLIVVAGMEGALPSVVGGLVDKPIIALPTSVGYGANFKGLSALLTMLNSCAPGIAVVNVDNGFGAGYMAGLINKLNEVEE
ncbi:MAG: nickel pincer cofactor biosynthesis protein LarB [Candidatus Caldatribacteriota bacterium]|nr:nickel pincer cofactor biosynthesis protein LarB [Candidatus Caldatribacteriota bacterium]